ncbi:hypothetical protein ACVWY4_005747 [Bacillus mycoides]
MNSYVFSPENFLFDGGVPCPDQQNALENILKNIEPMMTDRNEKLKAEIDQKVKDLNSETPNPSTGEAALGFDIDIDWKLQELKLHVPTISLEDRKIGSLNLPVIEMIRKEIVFHTPSVRMVPKKVGQYPEVKCKNFKCTTHWKDIIMDVPETFMQEQRTSIGLPSIKMEQKDIILGLPVVGMELKIIKLHIPNFKIKNIRVEAREAEEKAHTIENEINTRVSEEKVKLKNELQTQIIPPHSALFDCFRNNLEVTKTQVLATLDGYVTVNQTTVQQLKSQNVPNDNEYLKSVENTLNDLMAQKVEAEQEFLKSLEQINNEQRESLEKMTSKILEEPPASIANSAVNLMGKQSELFNGNCSNEIMTILNSLSKEELLKLLLTK